MSITELGDVPGAEWQRPRKESLALIYQEILTVISRLRTNRHTVKDAGAFRSSMKAAFAAADADAVRKGYSPEDIRLAAFAAMAFLDESVINLNKPVFADWARAPLQQELLGVQATGEIFYQVVDRLMARGDSASDADVLEVFGLCLLMGYRGRFSGAGDENVRPVVRRIADKVERVRGVRSLSPGWTPPRDALLPPPPDPWIRPLLLGALGALLLAVLFFGGFKIALISGASGMHSYSQQSLH